MTDSARADAVAGAMANARHHRQNRGSLNVCTLCHQSWPCSAHVLAGEVARLTQEMTGMVKINRAALLPNVHAAAGIPPSQVWLVQGGEIVGKITDIDDTPPASAAGGAEGR